MKKFAYIFAFGFLGLLLATLVHAVVEIYVLDVIFNNPGQFADTIWWQEWELIHGVFVFGLWAAGLIGGVCLGRKWWKPYGSKTGLFGVGR